MFKVSVDDLHDKKTFYNVFFTCDNGKYNLNFSIKLLCSISILPALVISIEKK